jgi:excisionase family DNA binding protein
MPDESQRTWQEFLALLRSQQTAPACGGSPWMGAEEAARYLGIALGTLRNWTSLGFIPCVKKGHVTRYHREVIDNWLAEGGRPGRTTQGGE